MGHVNLCVYSDFILEFLMPEITSGSDAWTSSAEAFQETDRGKAVSTSEQSTASWLEFSAEGSSSVTRVCNQQWSLLQWLTVINDSDLLPVTVIHKYLVLAENMLPSRLRYNNNNDNILCRDAQQLQSHTKQPLRDTKSLQEETERL